MGIPNLGASLYATGLGYDSAAGFMGANESRMALANQVGQQVMFGGELSPEQTARVASMDKAYDLQGQMAQVNYEASQAMFAGAQAARKKDRELKQRLLDAGATFV